jgi:hypothetical protein
VVRSLGTIVHAVIPQLIVVEAKNKNINTNRAGACRLYSSIRRTNTMITQGNQKNIDHIFSVNSKIVEARVEKNCSICENQIEIDDFYSHESRFSFLFNVPAKPLFICGECLVEYDWLWELEEKYNFVIVA